MEFLEPKITRPLFLLATTIALLAPVSSCAPRNGDDYRAEIRRTSYGIAHIEASDLGSVGFGEGYALAQDHFCTLLDQVIRARGERSRHFGPGEENEHLHSDLTYRALRLYEKATEDLESAAPEEREWLEGYVTGVNLYLEETGAENVSGWCRGEDWVQPITAIDLSAYRRMLGLMAPYFTGMIATARPPGEASTEGTPTAAARDLERFSQPASNGWALGSERSQGGRGMLIANPHYPWEGSNRFWEKHLTIPGELDAYGVGLIGVPGVAIGFNDSIAWTHTVSAGQRYTLYRLELVPGDPTSYLYDGETREMVSRDVSIEVLQEDGSLSTVTRTLYASHYGPILHWPEVGWTEDRVLTYRDANEENDESIVTYQAMMRAGSMDELQQAHEEHQGILFVNTIATSKEGRAWYADVSAAPHLSEEAIAAWRESLDNDPLARDLYQLRGTLLFDGSDSRFEWVEDSRARDPGIVPYAEVPQIERRDYVFNANDSYWTPHHEARLTGYSPAHGPENSPRSLRTRMNLTTLSDTSPDGPMGEDGRFSLDELADAALSNRSYPALILRTELVERCRATSTVTVDGETVDLEQACDILDLWDGRYDLDSRGAVLFREFMTQYDPMDLRIAGELFEVPFDPSAPLLTPRGLAEGDLALENLARAVQILERADFELDVPLGELQYSNKNNGRIPIHGGLGSYDGIENVVFYAPNTTTLEPSFDVAPAVKGSRTLTEEGYPITYGTSFIMALEFLDDGPQARAFLTYGQSGDWSSPHFTDQTKLFSKKEWRPILFRDEDIAADPNLEEQVVEAPRG